MRNRKGKRTAKKGAWFKKDTSKQITILTFWGGMAIIEQCLFLMWYAIRCGYGGAAAWLTAAVGVAEGMIMLVARRYLAMAESDHSEGGITYDSAKAKNFEQKSPGLDDPDE